MTAKLFIKTHGCQMNEYDSDRMADLLKDSHALTATDVPDDAEVILINTCSSSLPLRSRLLSTICTNHRPSTERAFWPTAGH